MAAIPSKATSSSEKNNFAFTRRRRHRLSGKIGKISLNLAKIDLALSRWTIDIGSQEVGCGSEQISGAASSHGEPRRITASPFYMDAREVIVELVRGSSETENLKVTSDALTK